MKLGLLAHRTKQTNNNKNNLKMDQRLFKSEPIKLLENVSVHHCDLGFDNGSFYMASKAQTITTTDKWDFTNIEIFCASKDPTKNEKTTCRVGENTCKYKELLSRI